VGLILRRGARGSSKLEMRPRPGIAALR
jgi:hypothetical protein